MTTLVAVVATIAVLVLVYRFAQERRVTAQWIIYAYACEAAHVDQGRMYRAMLVNSLIVGKAQQSEQTPKAEKAPKTNKTPTESPITLAESELGHKLTGEDRQWCIDKIKDWTARDNGTTRPSEYQKRIVNRFRKAA